MTTTKPLEVSLEAQGTLPNFRYETILPLVQGRVPIEGVTLKPSGFMESAGYFDNPKFKEGDFGLLDANWGDVVPAMDAGWDMVCLPVFIKRKPVWNYLWVRNDRDINEPKDLEGKTFSTGGYGSAITIYTRGFLQHDHGVDLHKLNWLLGAPARFDIHDKDVHVEVATGERKAPMQRLMDGEVDACTGDITDAALWSALESSSQVKRLFPDYQERNQKLFKEKDIYTPVHIILMGGKLNREHPELAATLYDAFQRSKETAVLDALGDGAGPSLIPHVRERFRDQQTEWGDLWKHGISANKNTINTFLDYLHEHGLTKSRLGVEQVFAAGTLNT
jgi:4,5-dihydroxyphthalate decarboxylase